MNAGGVKGSPRLFLKKIVEVHNENNWLGKKR